LADSDGLKKLTNVDKVDAILIEILNMKHQSHQSQIDMHTLEQHQRLQAERTESELRILEEKCFSLETDLEETKLHQIEAFDRVQNVSAARVGIEIVVNDIQKSIADHWSTLQHSSTAEALMESEKIVFRRSRRKALIAISDSWYSGIKTQLDAVQKTLSKVNFLRQHDIVGGSQAASGSISHQRFLESHSIKCSCYHLIPSRRFYLFLVRMCSQKPPTCRAK